MISLKELVESSSKINIPQNFIRLDQEPSSTSHPSTFPAPPTIDMSRLLSPQHSRSELLNLHSACKQWGLFQLVNHGVSSSLLEEVKSEIEGFFELPLDEKMKFCMKAGEFEGYGTVVRSMDQKLDWGDRFYMITNPLSRRKPHLLPHFPPSLRNTLESYLKATKKIAMSLLRMMAGNLEMEVRKMEELFEDGMEAVRMTYYPPCPRPELVVGLRPHSDATGVTILNQLNGVEGLQVKKDGTWFPVSFIPDGLMVNVGDVVEIMSNGVYNSIEHRAAVNSEKGRMSIAVFYNPRFEAEIGPQTQSPPLFRRIVMEDYFKDFFTQSFSGKSHLERMKIPPTNQPN
ncbi:Codeine O-demethylase, partial [Cucurbita argyrosperma subsp. argyrosperma]|uniref:Codeine O-demethylase-like n=1 Tax=Cucurbita moschata TaxID=3662 RepID=A0A6J1ED48_CUCMO